jgi:hypothetical protein
MLLKINFCEEKEKVFFSCWLLFCRHALMGVIEQVEKFKNDENEKCYMVFDLALALPMSVHY